MYSQGKVRNNQFFLCLTNYALRHKNLWGSGYIDPRILELGINWIEPHNLYSSPSIIRVIKSRRMRWGGHVARTADCAYLTYLILQRQLSHLNGRKFGHRQV
jgi:hypothetical protein